MKPLTDRVISLLERHGELSRKDIARKLKVACNDRFIGSIRALLCHGRIASRQEHEGRQGSSPVLYSLPKPVYVPQISCGSNYGWHATGSKPKDIRAFKPISA